MTRLPGDIGREASPGLWAVVGATGTGKSELALDLAGRLGDAEIVGADAMQLYRGMDIGTAKVPDSERRGIPHHMLDVWEVTEEAAVARYQAEAREAIAGILGRGRHAILVGGSGLYVSSVLFDFAFPPRDPALRERIEARLADEGAGALYADLAARAPETAARIDPRNTRRLVRALEVVEQGAAGHGAALPDTPRPWRAATVLGLRAPRPELTERLDRRVERMWEDGMLEETERLRLAGLEDGVTASRAIGYAQALAQLAGRMTRAEAIAETQALTRRYARRQVSWFRRYEGVRWIDA
ncbi:tRNA (adenosine(37)-N6)-dimethylallyltransferase MiaA [Microbacterium excoecariae]|uniref:tRNA (adenosine(37)-N6)-dimethylallyltransferase MiaA n=1 Tax=Microbacterium excoecariae TaxID=2715210 RepID=UPI0030B881D4